MPVMHVAMFAWATQPTEGHIRELQRRLNEMAEALPEVLSYRCGPDLGLFEGNLDFAVVSVVQSESDLGTYLSHPHHREIVDDLVQPILQHRLTVQVALPRGESPGEWWGLRAGGEA